MGVRQTTERPPRGREEGRARGTAPAQPEVALRLFLHLLEPRVVVRELVQMGERDLPGDDRVVAGDIGCRVVNAVLELDVHASAELVDIERRGRPVDADLLADAARVIFGKGHAAHYRFFSTSFAQLVLLAFPALSVASTQKRYFPGTSVRGTRQPTDWTEPRAPTVRSGMVRLANSA